MAVEYRIAQLLYAPRPELPELPGLLAEAVRRADREAEEAEEVRKSAAPDAKATAQPSEATEAEEQPELFVERGRWGYRTAREVVIPPLYDNGFDFTEGLAAVLLGRTWHFIDPEGHTRISCPGCTSVKPFRNGRALILRDGLRKEIDPAGREFDI